MRPASLFLLPLTLTATADAQTVRASYLAKTPLVVAAGPATRTLPAGTDLTSAITQMSVASPNGLGGAASQFVFHHTDRTGTHISIVDNGNMQVPGETAAIGAHETMLHLTPTSEVRAQVMLSYAAQSTLWPQHASAQGMIDIGDDGTFELAGTLGTQTSVELKVTIPTTGLSIKTIMSGTAAHPPGPASRVQYHASMQIRIEPIPQCRVSGGGGGCGLAMTPILFGEMTYADELLLTTQALAPNASVVTVIGTAPATLPIPGTPCVLDLAPLSARFGTADASGLASLALAIPPGLVVDVLFQQVVAIPNGILPLQPTGLLTLSCR